MALSNATKYASKHVLTEIAGWGVPGVEGMPRKAKHPQEIPRSHCAVGWFSSTYLVCSWNAGFWIHSLQRRWSWKNTDAHKRKPLLPLFKSSFLTHGFSPSQLPNHPLVSTGRVSSSSNQPPWLSSRRRKINLVANLTPPCAACPSPVGWSQCASLLTGAPGTTTAAVITK